MNELKVKYGPSTTYLENVTTRARTITTIATNFKLITAMFAVKRKFPLAEQTSESRKILDGGLTSAC